MTKDLLDPLTVTPWLQTLMLLCFSLAWPLANLRLWRLLRRGRAAYCLFHRGRGYGFTLVILCGYLAGVFAQVASALGGQPLGGLFWFYGVNALSVAINLALQVRARRRTALPQSS
jgi:hypothetical protein